MVKQYERKNTMKQSSKTLNESIIKETIKRDLGITSHYDISGYGDKGKNYVSYDYRENRNGWYVCLEFHGKKGHIVLINYLSIEQELIDFIKYFKKLKRVR